MMNSKIRVLQIIPEFGYGGAEVVAKDILMAQDREHFEIAACSLYPFTGTSLEKELQRQNIKVYYLTKNVGPDVGILKEIYDTFNDFKPHVIHTHRYVIRYTLIPSLLCRIPIKIHTIHNIAEKEVDLPGRILHFIAYHYFKYIPIGISKNISAIASSYYRIRDILYIYNGIQTGLYRSKNYSRERTRRSLGIADCDIVFISVGRLSLQKNYQLLIEAFRKVALQNNNAIYLLAGDGPKRLELEKIVKENEVKCRIRFLGIRQDIPELLAASDVFVLSSDWEGLPLAVIEAMTAGKPVIATAVGGVPELVVDGVNGILVPPGDETALAKAMMRIMADSLTREKMGEIGRRIAMEKYDINNMVTSYESLYLQELNRVDMSAQR